MKKKANYKILHGDQKPHGLLTVTEYINKQKVSMITMGIVDYLPGSMTGKDTASHNGIEVLIMIEGSIEVQIEDQKFSLSKGDYLEFDGLLPHRGWNPNKVKAKAVFLYLYSENNSYLKLVD